MTPASAFFPGEIQPARPSRELPHVLFFFANDKEAGTAHLRDLEAEADAIAEAMARAESLNLCRFIENRDTTAATIFDLLAEPSHKNLVAVMHFAGHANSYQLLLKSSEGELKAAYRQGFAEYMGRQQGLRLIFLNGCSTEMHAEGLLAAGVDAVIATDRAIADHVAAEFASRFYRNFGQGASIGNAFAEAAAAVRMDRGGTPRDLYHPDHVEWGDDRWPWKLHLRPGASEAASWSLPIAVGDPLFSLPQPITEELPDKPFRYLQPYGASHAELFWGRGNEIRHLYDWLTEPDRAPVLLVTGQSGAGKSSLIEAGLIPRLRTHKPRCATCVSGEELESCLWRALDRAKSPRLAEAWRTREADGVPLLIVVDQIERAISVSQQGSSLTKFAEALGALFGTALSRPAGRLLLAFRKEYLADVEAALVSSAVPFERYTLPDLSRQGISDIVEGVTRSERLRSVFKISIDPLLPSRMADYVLRDADSNVTPLLQVQLSRMWDEAPREPDGGKPFSLELFDKGKQFLDEFFDKQIADMAAVTPDAVASGLALDLLEYLSNPDGTTRERTGAELRRAYGKREIEILDGLRDRYLLVGATDRDPPSYRLAHDVIAAYARRKFDESLLPGQHARRILEARMKIPKLAASNAIPALEDHDLFLVEQGLQGMRSPSGDQLSLIQASKTARERARRKRVAAYAGAFAAVMLIAVISVAGLLTRAEKDRQRQAATIRSLAELALREASQIDQTSILILEEAFELSRRAEGVGMQEVSNAFRQILTQRFHVKGINPGGISATMASVDGAEHRLVYVNDDGLHVLDLDTRFASTLKLETGEEAVAGAIDPSGKLIVSSSKDGKIYLRSGDNFEHVDKLADDFPDLTSIAFSLDGTRILAGSSNGTLASWAAGRAKPMTPIQQQGFGHQRVAPSGLKSVAAIVAAQDGFFVGGGERIVFVHSDGTMSDACRLPEHTELSAMAIDMTSGEPIVGDLHGVVRKCQRTQGLDAKELGSRKASPIVGIVSLSDPAVLAVSTQNHGTTVYAGPSGNDEGNLGGDGLQVLAGLKRRHSLVVVDGAGLRLLEAADVIAVSRSMVILDTPETGASVNLSYLAFANKSKLLFAGILQEVPNALRRWDVSVAPPHELPPISQPLHVMSAYVSEDAAHVYTVDAYSVVHDWSLARQTDRAYLPIVTGGAGFSLAMDPTGTTLAASVASFSLEIIDLASGARRLLGSNDPGITMRAVAFSPWNADVISGGDDGMLRFWRRDGTGQARAAIQLDKPVLSLAIDARSGTLAVAAGPTVVLLRKNVGISAWTELPMLANAVAVAFSPSGSLIAATDSNGHTMVWDLRYVGGEPLVYSDRHVWPSRGLALAGNGQLATGAVNGRVEMETVDPSILATMACGLIEPSTVEDWSWTVGIDALKDVRSLLPVCGRSSRR